MFMNAEEARSDFVLAAAATLFGGLVIRLVAELPFYPGSGVVGEILRLLWVFALTGLVPYLLVRYREMGVRGFGLEGDRGGTVAGLLVAAPVAVLGIVRLLGIGDGAGLGAAIGTPGASLTNALFGHLSGAPFGDPTVGPGPSATEAMIELFFRIATVAVLWVGIVMLFTFLTTRARDGFRRKELPLVEGLRTFGMATAGIAFVVGLVAAILPSVTLGSMVLNVAGLAAMVLLADRLVTKRMSTSRATLLAPAIVALLLHIIGGTHLLLDLYAGALAAGGAIVLASLVETRRAAWAVVPVAAAMAIYPTCLSALPMLGTIRGC